MGDTVKHSVVVAGHPTSVSLEPVFWEELARTARTRGVSVNTLVTEVDRDRSGSLSSALRAFVVAELRRRAGL